MKTQPHNNTRFMQVLSVALVLSVTMLLTTSACQQSVPQATSSSRATTSLATMLAPSVPPTLALSLTVFQRVAQARSQPLPEEMLSLGGMNRIRGIMLTLDGEVILLGDRDPSWPSFHLEDLNVALKNAYHISAEYDGVLGVSIDPWSGARDPWAIQQTSVFGMPRTTRMAQRHLLIDYDLKRVSASIDFLSNGIIGTYELLRSASPPCNGTATRQHQSTHRFWYCARYPDTAPRFVEDNDVVMIEHPIGVQVLTEQEFRDRNGRRTGATSAAPQAQQFATQVSQLFTVPQPPIPYGQLLNDFRLIEIAALLRFKQVEAERFRYLLHGCPLTTMQVPQFVGGITRSEEGSVTCTTKIHERPTANGTLVESQAQVQRYQLVYRGGIEGKVTVDAAAVEKESTGVFAALRQQVHTSRPSGDVWIWQIN